MRRTTILAALLVSFTSISADDVSPPFNGTVWDLPSTLITEADPTSFRRVEYVGEHERHMWIWRDGEWHHGDQMAHVFDVSFRERSVEFQVLAELGDQAAARAEVELYAPILGRLPWVLREHLREVEIMVEGPRRVSSTARPYDWKGDPSWGMISVHTEEAPDVIRRGYMEEVFLHEGAHVSLDPDHRASRGWLDAQQEDPTFISTYARDVPHREDVAETFSAWFAVRYRPETLSMQQHQAIIEAVPDRLAYFDEQGFDMAPFMRAAPVPALPLVGVLLLAVAVIFAGRRRAVFAPPPRDLHLLTPDPP